MSKIKFPGIHYYNQDFVDIYNKCWYWLKDAYKVDQTKELNLYDTLMSTFFLCYNIDEDTTHNLLKKFYDLQTDDGYIPQYVDDKTNTALTPEDKPQLLPPILGWVEYNLYHKRGDKRRIVSVTPILTKYFYWVEANYRDDVSGLYKTPANILGERVKGREDAVFLVDFNAQQALNVLYISILADLQNDKDLSFQLKKIYYAIKTKINTLMWSEELQTYCDLDSNGKQIPRRYLGAFWTLLAKIPNQDQVENMVQLLEDPEHFGTKHPFPSLAKSEPDFNPQENSYQGRVFLDSNFMVIKGLEQYNMKELARESVIKHLYSIVDAYHLETPETKGTLWESYHPENEPITNRIVNESVVGRFYQDNKSLTSTVPLAMITLMIESVIGLDISLPRKTVYCYIPTMEMMGIEGLCLKRNKISILTSNTNRGWEIRLESEKLYYFTIEIVDENKLKTLPIPSGNCSMLIDKL